MAPRTAIIVVTYNSERYLDDLFASLQAHTDFANTRLLVVDNASQDGSERHALAVVDQLRIDMLAGAEHGQAHAAMLPDGMTDAALAAIVPPQPAAPRRRCRSSSGASSRYA